MPFPRATMIALLLGGASSATAQQWQWIRDRLLPGDFEGAMAYDEARERMVLFGCGDPLDATLATDSATLEWDGARWMLRHREAPAVRNTALVWDGQRRRVVRTCGSYGNTATGSTSEWDGESWMPRAGGIGARTRHAATFHATTGSLLVFGGHGAAWPVNWLGDTWELQGNSWTQRTVWPAPVAREGHVLGYDASRQRSLLFGGATNGPIQNPYRQDTWQWDGAGWQQLQPATVPPARGGAAMAFDPPRGRLVLFGGTDLNGERDDTWEWDGSNWQTVATAHRPPARSVAAMAFERREGRMLLYGGRAGYGYVRLTDTWRYDGSDWSPVHAAIGPARRTLPALTHDPVRGRTLVFGGFPGDGLTWETDGHTWTGVLAAPSPAPRYFLHSAFDLWRGRTVLFGGRDNVVFGDTWEWDGTAWAQRVATPAPAARSGGCMAFDAGRSVAVLFGGQDFSGAFDDTWEWNGATWTRRTTVHVPTAGTSHAMTYDLLLGRIVMFGGSDQSGARADTWHYDGVDWLLMATAGPGSPPPRYYGTIAWHPGRGRTILFGGGTWGAYRDDLWEWDGSQWTPWTLAIRPPAQADPAFVYDFRNQRLVLVNGWTGQVYGNFWVLVPGPPAAATGYGTGCSAGAPPRLRSDAPFLGNDAGTLELSQAGPQCPALLLGGLGAATVPLPAGCTLLLQAPFVTTLAVTNAHGVARFPLAVPPLPSLRGAAAHFQAAVLDNTGPLGGTSWTGGLRLVAGD